MKPPVVTAQQTVDALVAKSQRKTGVQLRRAFVQVGLGTASRPGVLSSLVRAHDGRALDLYLLVRLLAVAEPFHVEQPSAVWARAMGLTSRDTSGAISRIWLRLERGRLLARAGRVGRDTLVCVLHELGDGSTYTPPSGRHDPYLSLPLSYFADGWSLSLSLAAKAVLLVALYNSLEFELSMDHVGKWYGISAETLDAGARELQQHGLLARELIYRREPLTARGYVRCYRYRLDGAFARRPRPAVELDPDDIPF
jgi:hypothetical protein